MAHRIGKSVSPVARQEPRRFVQWLGVFPASFTTDMHWSEFAKFPSLKPCDFATHLLTMEALAPQQPSTAEEACYRLLNAGLDPELLGLVVGCLPGWVAVPAAHGRESHFLPRMKFIEHLLWLVGRWAQPTCVADEQTFLSHAALRVFGSRDAGVAAEKTIQEAVTSLGLAEEDEHGWSMELPRAFMTMCHWLGLRLHFQARWQRYGSVRVSCVADDRTLARDAGFWGGLAAREIFILQGRWLEQQTLDEVAARLRLSKERVRQIEKAAQQNMRGPRRHSMNRSFARALGQLPSCRLVQPEALVMTWASDLGAIPARGALFRLLERQLNVTPIPLCDGELWWLPFDDGPAPSDELRWTWETEGHGTPTLGESGVRLTRWEREAILNCRLAQDEAQTPRTMRDCLVQVLRSLGRPSRLADIRHEVICRYPGFVADTQHVYGVLNRHPDVFLVSSERGVYGLCGMEALLARETLELPMGVPPPPGFRPEPVATSPAPIEVAPEPPLRDAPEEDDLGVSAPGPAELLGDLPGGGLVELMAAIARTARRLWDVPAPRSLCEIGISEADYEALCAWAAGLSRRPLKAWIRDARPCISVANGHCLSLQEGVGMLLLLDAAETGRRKAKEGHLWTDARKIYSAEAESFLFANGQPTWPHKEALQAAARALGLRHVFGREGTQEYYITTYLQFGFTRSAIQRMPEWLSGFATSAAVQRLSGEEGGSASFRELWRALLDFRRGNIPEARAREVCAGSPWLLPSWVDEILAAVRTRLTLSQAPKGADTAGTGAPLLETPRLRWVPGQKPVFVTSIINLEGRGLEEPGYTLRFEPHGVPVYLYRREDGGYDTPDVITLPADAPRYRVELRDGENNFIETMTLDLWSPDEDVAAFDLPSGSPVDAWRSPMSLKRGYALLLASDLEITPGPAFYHAMGKTHTLYYLSSDWPEELRVTLGGEELWTPNLARAKRPEREQPEWAGVFFSKARKVDIGTRTPAIPVPLPPGVALDFVRLGPEPLEFRVDADGACIEPFDLGPERLADGLTATFGLRRGGRRAVVRQQLPILPIGVLRFGPDGCRALRRDADLRARDLRNDALQLFMPASVGDGIVDALALVVGEAYHNIRARPLARGLLTTRPISWRTAAGFGAPLLARRPYNTVDPQSAFQVARAVCDTGNIKSTTFDDNRVTLELDGVVEPGPGHRVLLWDPWLPETAIAHNAIAVDGRYWRISIEGAPPSVAAIFYEGALTGAWGDAGGWSKALADGLTEADREAALLTAAMLRGLRLPLLHPEVQDAIQRFAAAFPAECLRAWMRGEGLPASWEAPTEDEAWFGVIRAVFMDWEPTRDEPRRLLESLADADAEDPYLDVIEQMIVVHPRLAARVAAAWKDDTEVTGFGPDELAAILRRIAGLESTDDDVRVRQWIAETVEAAAESMNVDPKFLENLIRPVPHHAPNREAAATNLSMALTVSPFRRGMALHLLREV